VKLVLGYRGTPPPAKNQRRLEAGLKRRLRGFAGQLVVDLGGEGLAITDMRVSVTQATTARPAGIDARGALYGALVEAGFAVLALRPPHGPQVAWVDSTGAPCDPPGDAPEWVEVIGWKVGRSLQVTIQRDGAQWRCASATTAGDLAAADLEGFRRDVESALLASDKAVRLRPFCAP
jgi:hypothetical protein